MATLTKGYTFTEHERVTVAALHALVESATLNNVANADLVAGLRIINSATPGSPITGDMLIGSDYLLDLYYSGAFNGQPDGSVALTLTNNSAATINQGCPVVISPGDPTKFKLMSEFASRLYPLGVAAANIGIGVSGSIVVNGYGYIRMRGNFAPGDFIRYDSDFPGQNCVVTTTPMSDSFAMALESGGPTAGTLCWSRLF